MQFMPNTYLKGFYCWDVKCQRVIHSLSVALNFKINISLSFNSSKVFLEVFSFNRYEQIAADSLLYVNNNDDIISRLEIKRFNMLCGELTIHDYIHWDFIEASQFTVNLVKVFLIN